MQIDPTILSNLALFLSGFGVVFLIVLWISLILWTVRDIRRRSRDNFIRVLSVLVSTLLFIPGVLVYILIRPTNTLEEEYQKNLEEEALMQTLDDVALCPGCSKKVDAAWMVCPSCHTRLKKKCVSCGKMLDINWDICPYCETPAPGFHRSNIDLDDLITKATFPTNPDQPELE